MTVTDFLTVLSALTTVLMAGISIGRFVEEKKNDRRKQSSKLGDRVNLIGTRPRTVCPFYVFIITFVSKMKRDYEKMSREQKKTITAIVQKIGDC